MNDSRLDAQPGAAPRDRRHRAPHRARDAGSGIGTTGAAIDLAPNGPQLATPGTVEVAAGQHHLDVFAGDRAGNLAARQRAFTAYAYEWLPPLVAGAGQGPNFTAGRTIPVRFVVRRADGTAVVDESVVVDLTDADGRPVVAPLTLSGTPAGGVVVQNGTYHADLGTKGLAPGAYVVRARFGSAQLTGELQLAVTLQ